MPTRAWYEVRPDRLVHGFSWMTDEQALVRLERGEQWRPFRGIEETIIAIRTELQGAEK